MQRSVPPAAALAFGSQRVGACFAIYFRVLKLLHFLTIGPTARLGATTGSRAYSASGVVCHDNQCQFCLLSQGVYPESRVVSPAIGFAAPEPKERH